MARYRCAECGMAVIVPQGEEPIRGCACTGAIVADATVTLAGVGAVATGRR